LSPELTTADIDAMTEALASLAAIPAAPALRSLPMLADEPPLSSVRSVRARDR
jgi:hypothetical protein